jgi:hypothetical protein
MTIRWGEACSMLGRDEKCIQNFSSENLKERDHSEDLGVDGKVILDLTLGKGWKGGNLFNLVQDRDQWRVLVNTNEPSCSIKGGEFLD